MSQWVSVHHWFEISPCVQQVIFKPCIPLIVGSSTATAWKTSTVGLIIAGELYCGSLLYLQNLSKSKKLWVNNVSQVIVGWTYLEIYRTAAGNADPRQLAQYLIENGIPVWLDVNNLGKDGLYEDIAAGARLWYRVCKLSLAKWRFVTQFKTWKFLWLVLQLVRQKTTSSSQNTQPVSLSDLVTTVGAKLEGIHRTFLQ